MHITHKRINIIVMLHSFSLIHSISIRFAERKDYIALEFVPVISMLIREGHSTAYA